jgi:predicted acyl esterase
VWPEAFTPGGVEEVDFTMQDVNHTFRRGHRIMVQMQSSWFPLTDRNPQTFVNIPDAKPEDFVKATERVYHAKGEASGIVVGVVEPGGGGRTQIARIKSEAAVQLWPRAAVQ